MAGVILNYEAVTADTDRSRASEADSKLVLGITFALFA